MISRRFILKGRVQGVGFRFFTCNIARELGVVGWVKNLGSGEVEIRAQGKREAMALFLDRLRSGPPFSRVRDLRIEEAEREDFARFSVRR